MAFKLADRVRETSITSGSGSIVINDTFGGFQSFASGIGNNNQTFYTIENGQNFEVGIGTYNNNILTRDIILDSNNASGNKIYLDGVSTVFCTYPASQAVFLNKDGYISGVMPQYSGIILNGLIQTKPFLGSGSRNNVCYWLDEHTINGSNSFIWDNLSNTLYVDGNLSVSGSILEAQFVSESSASLFHAYVNNAYNNIICLHSTNEEFATWKLGLKPYSNSFSDPPTHGYIYGDIDSIGCVANDNNLYTLNYTNGFWVQHRGANLLNVDRNNGVNIYNNSPVEVPLTINAATSQASNLQEFKNSLGSPLLSVNRNGSIIFERKITNAEAPNSSLYYSSTNNKLVFKDSNGSIHELY